MKGVYKAVDQILIVLIGLGMVGWGAFLLHMYFASGTCVCLVASAITFAVANLILRSIL